MIAFLVVATHKEPIPGWINNYYGPTGIVASLISGLVRTMHCNEKICADIVPVDTCVSALIASAWEVANTKIERYKKTQYKK